MYNQSGNKFTKMGSQKTPTGPTSRDRKFEASGSTSGSKTLGRGGSSGGRGGSSGGRYGSSGGRYGSSGGRYGEDMVQILRMGNNIIECKIISGGKVGTICAIPRMVISPSDSKMPFKLNRRQFPVQVRFAMTINKSQGQTLSQVGLFLQRQVFSHGQLYVAVSRVKKNGLKVICCDHDGNYTNSTTNVVYKEVLFRL